MYKLCTATPSMNKVTFSMVILCFRCLFIYNFKRWRLHILKPSAFYIYILCQIMYKNSGGMSFYVQKKGWVCHAMYIFSAIFPEKPKNYVFLCRKKLCPFMSPFSLVTIYTCIYIVFSSSLCKPVIPFTKKNKNADSNFVTNSNSAARSDQEAKYITSAAWWYC